MLATPGLIAQGGGGPPPPPPKGPSWRHEKDDHADLAQRACETLTQSQFQL